MELAMHIVNIHEAKTHLSRLVDKAAKGESFIIAKSGKPMVKVIAIDAPAAGETRPGSFPFRTILIAWPVRKSRTCLASDPDCSIDRGRHYIAARRRSGRAVSPRLCVASGESAHTILELVSTDRCHAKPEQFDGR
jgi:prevent-host-death family protein